VTYTAGPDGFHPTITYEGGEEEESSSDEK